MLALTKKTDYALIALSHLARCTGGPISARHIAEHYGVPLPLLMNVLKRLSRHGMVQSVRGAKGGYQLAASAEDISLATLIEAMEGPIGLVQCAVDHGQGHSGAECRVSENCPVRWPARRIHDKLQDFLQAVTLADMIDRPFDTLGRNEGPEAEPDDPTVTNHTPMTVSTLTMDGGTAE